MLEKIKTKEFTASFIKQMKDKNITDILSKYPDILFHACKENKELMVFLLNKGANVNSRNNFNETLLIIACIYNPESALELIKRKADINAQDREGDVALSMACWFNPHLMSLLIKTGANPNIKNNKGLDVLSYSKRVKAVGREDLEKILLEKYSFGKANKTRLL